MFVTSRFQVVMEGFYPEKRAALAPPPPPPAPAVVQLRFNRGSAFQPRPFRAQPGETGENQRVQCLIQMSSWGFSMASGEVTLYPSKAAPKPL